MTLSQYLFNNLWWGEQKRESQDSDFQTLVTVYVEPDYSKAWYIDISPWDGGAVQLGVTKALGCSGVWIKGVDGSVNSSHFVANYTTAVNVGLPRSSYAWLYRDANVRATAQAQAFDTLLNKYPPSPELLPLVDFEYTKYAGVQSNPNFDDLRRWLAEWLRLGNPKPIVYSGKYYMDQFGQMPSDVRGMIAGLHIANYSSLNPPLPLGFTSWIYHQFSSTGDAMKIAPNNVNKLALDLNYGHGAVVSPPPTGDTMLYGRINTGTLNVRNGAGASYTDIGDVILNDYVIATESIGGWWHLKEAYRGSWTGAPVALANGTLINNAPSAWCSSAYIVAVPAPPAPPPPVVDSIIIDIAVSDVKTAGDRYEVKGVKAVKVA